MSSIIIDFEGIENIVSKSKIVADEVQTCKSTIHTISDHSDWNCKERDQVIATIESVKKGYDELANLSDECAAKLLQLKEEVEKFDKLITGRYSDIQTELGDAVSIKPDGITIHAGSAIKEIVSSQPVPICAELDCYSVANALDGIQVCSYSDIGLN